MTATLPPERVDELAEALAALHAEGWDVHSEHDPGCPGGGYYCEDHCPVPAQHRTGPADLATALAPLVARWVAEAEQRAYEVGYDSGCDDPDSMWTSTKIAFYDKGRAEVVARVEAVDFASRRLGMAFPDPEREGWNRALEVCRADLRAALATGRDEGAGE